MIVIDASLILHLLLDAALEPEVVQRTRDAGDLAAPHLLDLEILSAVRRRVLAKEIDVARAASALDDFEAFEIERSAVHVLNRRIWEMRNNLTPYDAAYVALAEWLDVPLYTRDAGIARAAGKGVEVVLL